MTDWTVESYIDPQGRSPVEEFLDRLPAGARARIDHTIGLLKEFGLQLGRGNMERGEGTREHYDKEKSKPSFRRVS